MDSYALLSYKLIWSIIVIIGVVNGSHLSSDILDAIGDAFVEPPSCSSNAENCLDDPDHDGSGNTNTITLIDVTSDDNNYCCYKYKSVFDGTETCSGKSTSQSHWTLGYFCIDDGTSGSSNGISDIKAGGDNTGSNPQEGVDSSTCYSGIKFDDACGGNVGDECFYEVCILWNNNLLLDEPKCCTSPGWYLVKSGNEFGFDQVDIPQCNCETGI